MKTKMIKVTLTLPKYLVIQMDRICKRLKISRSEFVRCAVEYF